MTTASMNFFDAIFRPCLGGPDPGKDSKVPPGFASASHILLTGDGAEEAAAELQQRLAAGELSFTEAAEQFSQCPSKGKGGELGIFSSLSVVMWLPYEGKTNEVKLFDELVFSPSTPIGTPFRVATSFGTHIVRVDARG